MPRRAQNYTVADFVQRSRLPLGTLSIAAEDNFTGEFVFLQFLL